MYLQITNKTLSAKNQIQLFTPEQDIAVNVAIKVKQVGWKLSDVIIKQLRDELVTTRYRGVDGKNTPLCKREYKTRAKMNGTGNKVISSC
jgi:hypothetical protein